jgi:glutamate carboxypeptidase
VCYNIALQALRSALNEKLLAMSNRHQPILDWIDAQRERMAAIVTSWANINSGSLNVAGIQALAEQVANEFAILDGELVQRTLAPMNRIDASGESVIIPLGKAISIRKRSHAANSVLLSIHLDTVYGQDNPFQSVSSIDANTLRGPGVADAKGGILVMLMALQAFEQSPLARNIGWEILLNPDEELGSPGSAPLLEEAARRSRLGMVFEPALPDGNLVGARKGSGNFVAVIHGRSAHVGRDFTLGRNAIHAAAAFTTAVEGLNGTITDATFNVAKIDGGGPSNVVPDLAIVRLNIRIAKPEHEALVRGALNSIIADMGRREGITINLTGYFSSPPKPMDSQTESLYRAMAACGREMDLDLTWSPSGGASDANKLAAAGLPAIDSLGPRGGNIHSNREFILLDSLPERAKLSALFLLKLAAGEIEWPNASGLPKTR